MIRSCSWPGEGEEGEEGAWPVINSCTRTLSPYHSLWIPSSVSKPCGFSSQGGSDAPVPPPSPPPVPSGPPAPRHPVGQPSMAGKPQRPPTTLSLLESGPCT